VQPRGRVAADPRPSAGAWRTSEIGPRRERREKARLDRLAYPAPAAATGLDAGLYIVQRTDVMNPEARGFFAVRALTRVGDTPCILSP
jgi:hypothetical protein